MASKSLCFVVLSLLVAYYVYIPLPDNIEDKWMLTFLDASLRTLGHVGSLAEFFGIKNYMDALMLLTYAERTEPTSDECLSVTDTSFNSVPVRLFIPKKDVVTLRRAVIFIHGGGWCIGSPAMMPYDSLARKTAKQLDAVVVSIDYRLAPKVHFPTQFDDVYAVVTFFLDENILAKYSVDPKRIAVSGDSAGGNLAAAVAQQLLNDHEVKVKLKIQALIYPVLQALDLNTPSYRDNAKMPVLSRTLMVRFWSEYFTSDGTLLDAMLSNRHIPLEAAHLFKFVNWSTLLPENLKNNYMYKPLYGHPQMIKKYPGLLDTRASPLLSEDEKLKGLPLAYVITCMYDVLRDDGFMYISRLKKAGVQVEHAHYDNAFHGIVSLNAWPFDFSMANHITNKYLSWLDDNL